MKAKDSDDYILWVFLCIALCFVMSLVFIANTDSEKEKVRRIEERDKVEIVSKRDGVVLYRTFDNGRYIYFTNNGKTSVQYRDKYHSENIEVN